MAKKAKKLSKKDKEIKKLLAECSGVVGAAVAVIIPEVKTTPIAAQATEETMKQVSQGTHDVNITGAIEGAVEATLGQQAKKIFQGMKSSVKFRKAWDEAQAHVNSLDAFKNNAAGRKSLFQSYVDKIITELKGDRTHDGHVKFADGSQAKDPTAARPTLFQKVAGIDHRKAA